MQNLLNRISTQLLALQANTDPDDRFCFNVGATDDDFAKLEAVIGNELPNEFKDLYRLANGEKTDSGNFLAGDIWLPVDGIITEYQVWKGLYDEGIFQDDGTEYGCEPDVGVKPDFWFNPKWIPLTADGGGNGKMIDLDPTPQGTVGQVIQMWHDDPARTLEAMSLTAFLEKYAQDLEAGNYVFHPDYGVILKDDLSDDELAQIHS